MDRELADVVPHPLDVIWDGFGMANLRRPPPEARKTENNLFVSHFQQIPAYSVGQRRSNSHV